MVDRKLSWAEGVMPAWPEISVDTQIKVRQSKEILDALRNLTEQCCQEDGVGILLSGGIDSAILAALMPKGLPAYTIKFDAEGALDESETAKVYADHCGLEHHIVDVTWDDHQKHMDKLMLNKKSPLHAVEVGLFKAASIASEEGVKTLILGNGADSTFGGMDKLLSRDWTFDEFVKRYTFIEPSRVLKEPVSVIDEYEKYRRNNSIDTVSFLKTTHGIGIIQAFDNAIGSAGCKTVEPYEHLVLDTELDMERIRNGQSKYFLRDIFKQLYPGLDVPEKIPFARPMDQWLKDWKGPTREEFLDDIDIDKFAGEQKWLIYCLERFLNCFDKIQLLV